MTKSSQTLKEESNNLRVLICFTLKRRLQDAIKAYVQSVQNENRVDHEHIDVETNGYLQLRTAYIHKMGEDQNSDNVVVDAIHTDYEKRIVSIRFDGDNSDLNFDELSNENLIAIVEELEYFIENPDKIEII